eukprot:Skav217367  [mRNA]  locus=scaffold1119:27233:30564:+ [translate_table: standard]
MPNFVSWGLSRYRWLSSERFAELFAMANCLPGPSSTQAAIACSAVGVALVFIAISGLIKKQICLGAGAICLLVHPAPAWLNPSLIFLGGLITILIPATKPIESVTSAVSCPLENPCLRDVQVAPDAEMKHADDTGKSGMFVWGGGPVVLPMLMTFLTPQWISPTIFLAGISFAEMMPGPVFNISCFLGIQLALNAGWNWLAGIAVCWAGLMLPGITLIFGAYTLWDELRKQRLYQHALPGLNAAAVGLLVPTMFVVYDTLQVNVPAVVITFGVVGFCWALAQQENSPVSF